ncbi:hypothetical protein B0H12DRAFT_266204 [Mycena haematopus]|nr:hypothetical protein B0H12DRAFT_266204 [Mycena haematopus]
MVSTGRVGIGLPSSQGGVLLFSLVSGLWVEEISQTRWFASSLNGYSRHQRAFLHIKESLRRSRLFAGLLPMPHQDPPFPSISLVLSQHAQSTPISYIAFPWASVSYHPAAPAPIHAFPIPAAQPQPSVAPTPNTHTTFIRAFRKFFANIVTGLRAWITS